MKQIYIVTGKISDIDFVKKQLSKKEDIKIIGVDGAIDVLVKLNIRPDLVIGDFDSISDQAKYAIGLSDKKPSEDAVRFDLYDYEIVKLNPIKDDTDTEAALRHIIKYMKHDGEVIILGATEGSRIDHLLGNISLLEFARSNGLNACLLDAHNRIRMIKDDYKLLKSEAYGSYISIIPHYNDLEKVSLSGFKYNLENSTISKNTTLGISNELVDTEGVICAQGIYLLIESRD